KKILILDNHDDFGGHAKRNEHMVDGDLRIGQGGSESLEGTGDYNDTLLDMFKDIGIDMDLFKTTYDTGFFKRHGLGAAMYFNKKVFGEDKVVQHPLCDYPGFITGLMRPTISFEEAVAQTPLSDSGKEQLLRVVTADQSILNIPKEDLPEYINNHSYFDYLKNTLGVDDQHVLRIARHTSVDYTEGGTDALSLAAVLSSGPLGGDPMVSWKDALGEGDYQNYVNKDGGLYETDDPFIHHFPDGNATIARCLVKKMIPNVGPGENAEEIILSKFNYAQLDKTSNSTRLRLNSTVVNVKHDGNPNTAKKAFVNYIKDGKSYQVKAKGVVMACYNMIIPHIVSDLPQDQHAALRNLTKVPLQYSTVGLRNWRAMKELGLGMVMSPGNMHTAVNMDFPVSVGGYEYTKTPDDPCILHMRAAPRGDTVGAPLKQQYTEARYRMLGLEFADYEQEIREHLNGMLPKELFQFDRDVVSISVNRWAHGYSHGNPGAVGRQRFGRITIANSDANDVSLANNAIMQAHRAVKELN
ncbi:MAG: hypothetical protein P8J14_03980, partial [Emcibacteraceae bacterium]|nr:hypothetical protein [Emcibacteraceae bacterium]